MGDMEEVNQQSMGTGGGEGRELGVWSKKRPSSALSLRWLSLCLFTITVPRMNLPRMTAQLAAPASQEQGSY